MKNVVSLILGGGKGTRLFPLTQLRSKPAVPLAGKYRLIDIPISNCINSELNRIYLLTQFNSVSLHRHIRQTYKFDSFGGGFVEILAAQQTMEGTDWYQGTADAVRKNIRCIEQSDIDYVLILSGDQLYRMDYSEMLTNHIESKADVSIATVPLSSEQASAFGIMRVDDTGRVKGFLEKPQTEEDLSMVRTSPEWIDQQGIESRGRDCLASMGIYLFNRDLLVDLLKATDYEDFGKEIFPMSIRTHKVHAHLFDGYWEDIGTIRSFYEANLALAHPQPPFDFVVEKAPIYSRPRFLPPTRCEGTQISRSLIADGCEIDEGSVIENSVIGLRCRIGKNVTIRNSVIMGADYYQDQCKELDQDDRPPIGIGDGAYIDGAIVDKNCRVGKGARIELNGHTETDFDQSDVMIRDGIIVVPKGTVLEEGWKL